MAGYYINSRNDKLGITFEGFFCRFHCLLPVITTRYFRRRERPWCVSSNGWGTR